MSTRKRCPDTHTLRPSGYIDHEIWAERKFRTHEPTQCPECGLWAIWKKRDTPLTKAEVEAAFHPPGQKVVVLHVDRRGQLVLP